MYLMVVVLDMYMYDPLGPVSCKCVFIVGWKGVERRVETQIIYLYMTTCSISLCFPPLEFKVKGYAGKQETGVIVLLIFHSLVNY